MAYVSMKSLADALGQGLSGKAYFGPGSSGATPPPNVDLISRPVATPPPPPAQAQWAPVTSVASALDTRSLQTQNTYVAQQMEKGWTAEQMAAQPVYQNYAMQQMQAELNRLRTLAAAAQPNAPDEYTKRLVEAQARAAAEAKAKAEAQERARLEAEAKARAEAEAKAKAQAEAEAKAAAMTQVESPYGQVYSPTYAQYEQPYQQPTQTYQQPVQTYQQPAQTYQQPVQTYQQPAQTYQQPAQTYQQPPEPVVAPVTATPTPSSSIPGWVKPAGALAALFAAWWFFVRDPDEPDEEEDE